MSSKSDQLRDRFQFSLSALLWLVVSCAIGVTLWIAYRNPEFRYGLQSPAPLSTSLWSLALIVSLAATLSKCQPICTRNLPERIVVVAALGVIIGLGVHFYVIGLLGSTGAMVALDMKEDNWGDSGLHGVVIRVMIGIISAVAFAVIGGTGEKIAIRH